MYRSISRALLPSQLPQQHGGHVVRRAIALRHERSELRHGDFRVISARPGSGLLAFERRCGGKAVAVCLNAAGTPAQAPVCGETLWADGLDGGVLAPWGFAVFEK